MKSDFRKKIETLGGVKLNVVINEIKELPINETEVNRNIANAEGYLNSKIPKTYIDFIREFGAITFIKPVITKGVEKIPIADEDNQISIDNFFGFSDNEASVIKVLSRFKGNIPNHVLPICEGAPGDLIVIDLSAQGDGKIHYWHHEHDDSTNGLYLVANSFSNFLENLSVKEEINTTSGDVKVTKVSDKFLERLRKSGKM